MVGPGAGLGAPVLDDLEVVGLPAVAGLGEGVPRRAEQAPRSVSLPTAWSGAMLAGRRDDRPPAAGRAGLGERDLADARGRSSRASLVGPDDVEREVLEHPDADAVAGRQAAVGAAERRSSIGSAARANRSRWKARSTTVATHQPVIGVLAQLEQAGGHRQRPARGRRPGASVRGELGGRAKAVAKIAGGARRRESVARSTRRSSRSAALAGDRGRDDAGHPARVDQVEVGEVDGRR